MTSYSAPSVLIQDVKLDPINQSNFCITKIGCLGTWQVVIELVESTCYAERCIFYHIKMWTELDIKFYEIHVIDMECSKSKPTLSGSTAEWNTDMKITRNLYSKPWKTLGLQVPSNITYITHRKVGITYVTHTGKYILKYWVECQCIHQNLLTLIKVSCTMSINSEYVGVSK